MAFEGLTEKISATFKKLRGKGRLKDTSTSLFNSTQYSCSTVAIARLYPSAKP